MSDIRTLLEEANTRGELVSAAVQLEHSYGDHVHDVLISFQTNGTANLPALFQQECISSDNTKDLFQPRHLFEQLLPKLNVPVVDAIATINCFIQHAPDAASGAFDYFIKYLKADTLRIHTLKDQIMADPDANSKFITSMAMASDVAELATTVDNLLLIIRREHKDSRIQSIFALSKLDELANSTLAGSVFDVLATLAAKDEDGPTLRIALISLTGIFGLTPDYSARLTEVLGGLFAKDNRHVQDGAASVLAYDQDKISQEVLEIVLQYLLRTIQSDQSGIAGLVDLGLARLLERPDPALGLKWLPHFVAKNIFSGLQHSSVQYTIVTRNPTLMHRLLTTWFLADDTRLHRYLADLIDSVHGAPLLLRADTAYYDASQPAIALYLARKTIGYLFQHPVTCANVILSLIEDATDPQLQIDLADLLFNPLLLNYGLKTREYLENRKRQTSAVVKTAIEAALAQAEAYLNALKNLTTHLELHPTQEQREAYQRYYSALVAESYKEAEKQSVFLQIVNKQVLLYGRKAITYTKSEFGPVRRMEIPMVSHTTQGIEMPRMQVVDPLSTDLMLRIFRNERFLDS